MKEQDKTLKQALQKAANEGAIAENPAVEITPSAELDKKMNAFFDSVESRNAESTEQQYTSDKTGTVGNNYSDVLFDAFESDIADYDRDYDDPDTVESKNQGDSNAVGFGGKIRSLFVPFSRRTVGVILFAIAGVLLVVSLVSMAKTAAVNGKHDSCCSVDSAFTERAADLERYRYSGRRHADSADRRKRHGFNCSARDNKKS